MKSLVRNLIVVGLLGTTLACGDDNDETAATPPPINNPVENPTGQPNPAPFAWASARFDEEVEECEGNWRFTINANGNFRSTTCNTEQNKSGRISAADLTRFDQAMDAISRAEASANAACSNIENPAGLKNQRVSMASTAGRRYTLYSRNETRECYRGIQSENVNLRNLLYELRSVYVNSAFN